MRSLLILALALPLAAQEPLTIGAVTRSYLLLVNDHDAMVCKISVDGHLFVAKDKEQKCWIEAVTAHNEWMNNAVSHKAMDEALLILAVELHKPLVRCKR